MDNTKVAALRMIECSRQEIISKVNECHDNLMESINDQADEFSRSLTNEESKLNTNCISLEKSISILREPIISEDIQLLLNKGNVIQ
jgi:hypothetical protein